MWRRPSPSDWAIALTGTAITELVVWTGMAGTHVAGPRWFTASLPLLLDLPLAWRRLAPLLAWLLVVSGFVLHSLATRQSAEGLEMLYAIFVGAYSVAAHARRPAAVAGLAAFVAGYTVYAFEDPGVGPSSVGSEWAAAFFGLCAVALWFAGFWMHSRREAGAIAVRAAAIEQEAVAAVAEERARMARELHDIVSHNLSVVVLQAAGARAAGAGPATLEKIERSGREALVEMRRLLCVLREDGDAAGLAPQPGIAQLEALAAGMREAGLPVELRLVGTGALPPALELCVYRIVQEALTNALKHAGPARATVAVARAADVLTVEVSDDGAGAAADGPPGGHGLVGMHERVARFGGELRAGPRVEGGYAVTATLPVEP
ncbi:MAG TPA: histidine kinase [Gaiellaceae bacterium]|nr:histidine kinase [Gaiellaceae bacterium]